MMRNARNFFFKGSPGRIALAAAMAVTLILLLWRFFFFEMGRVMPVSSDVHLGNYARDGFHFPPRGMFSLDSWLGLPLPAPALNPFTLAARAPAWIFFTAFYPLCAAGAVAAFYLFLRQLKCRRGVAVAGGLLYGWQGDLLSSIYAGHFPAAAMYALFPLALASAWRCGAALGRGNAQKAAWRFAALTGAVCGMLATLLPDRALLCSVLAVLVLVWRASWREEHDWDVGSHLSEQLIRQTGLALVLVGIFAAGVGAPGIQGAWQQAIAKVHATAGPDSAARYAWATQWSWPPEETLSWLVPGFFGWHSGSMTGPYWGRLGAGDGLMDGLKSFSLGSNAFGSIGCILTLIGIICVWRRRKAVEAAGDSSQNLSQEQRSFGRFLSLAALGAFLLGLGKFTPLYRVFWLMPLMDAWRNPIKFLMPATTCLIVLAALALEALARGLTDVNAKDRRLAATLLQRWLGWGAVILAIATVGFVPGKIFFQAWLARAEYSTEAIKAASTTAHGALIAAALAATAGWGIAALIQNPWRERMRAGFIPNPWIARLRGWAFSPVRIGATAAVILAGLNCLQQLWVAGHYIMPLDMRAAQHRPEWVSLLQLSNERSPARAHLDPRDAALRHCLTVTLPQHGIPALDIAAASRVPDDYEVFFSAIEGNDTRVMDLAGVRFWILSSAEEAAALQNPIERARVRGRYGLFLTMPGIAPSGQIPSHVLIERGGALEKMTWLSEVEALTESELTKRLGDPAWDPRRFLLLTHEQAAILKTPEHISSEKKLDSAAFQIARLAYEPGRLDVIVQTPQPGYALVNDRFDSHWQLQVNGRPAPVVRANGCMTAFAVPEGVSRMTLEYVDRGWAVWIELAALIVLGGWFVAARRSRGLTGAREASTPVPSQNL